MKNLYFTNLRYHATYIKVTYIKVSNNILMYLFEMVKEHLFDIFFILGEIREGQRVRFKQNAFLYDFCTILIYIK